MMKTRFHVMLLLAVTSSCTGGTVHSNPHQVASDTVTDSAQIVAIARHVYNQRRIAQGMERLPAIGVERFLGRDSLHFVQFASPDTGYHGGNVVRVMGHSAVVVDTLPIFPPCMGARATFGDAPEGERRILQLAVDAYWRALGRATAACSDVTVSITRHESAGGQLVLIMENLPRLIYGGAVVRVQGDSAEVLNVLQR